MPAFFKFVFIFNKDIKININPYYRGATLVLKKGNGLIEP
jgi:hypothetical protein